MNKDRYKFYLISFLLVSLIITNIFAGTTGKIAGYVSDASTGEPLPGVNVLIEGTFLMYIVNPSINLKEVGERMYHNQVKRLFK